MSNKLEQIEFILEKIIGIWKHAGKVGKNQLLTTSDLEDKEDYF